MSKVESGWQNRSPCPNLCTFKLIVLYGISSLSYTTLVMILVVENVRFISCGTLLLSLKWTFKISYFVESYGPHDNWLLIQVESFFHVLSCPWWEHFIYNLRFGLLSDLSTTMQPHCNLRNVLLISYNMILVVESVSK